MTIIYYNPPVAPKSSVIFYKKPPEPPSTLAKLSPGASLSPGDSLVSSNGKFLFAFQKDDGNLVVYNENHQPLWAAGANPAGVLFAMQTDGNLVLYNAAREPLWATDTSGNGGAYFVMQSDGNAVLYSADNRPLWDTRTWGGVSHEERSWLAEAVATAGRPFAAVIHGVAQGFKDVGKALGNIPLVGPALSGVLLIASGPFTFTNAVVQGERLDRALIADFRDKLTAIREVAPYAQTVVSFIPGIGQGVSAAIGAGLALAQGKPLDEALIAGIEDAMPGGPAAKAAFRLTVAAASGDNLIVATGSVAIDVLGLDPASAQALHKALGTVYDASQGENIALAALENARDLVPSAEGRQAFDVAVAVAQGKKLQDAVIQGVANMTPAERGAIADVGASLIAKTPALQAAGNAIAVKASRSVYGTAAHEGYVYGIGVMHHAGVNEKTLNMLRDKLANAAEKQGFDVAVSVYKGAVTTHAPADAPPAASAAYFAAKGVSGNPNPMVKEAVKSFFIVNPVQAKTWTVAAQRYAPSSGFFAWLRRKLGI